MKVKYPKPLNSPAAPAVRVATFVESVVSSHARGMEATSRTARRRYRAQGLHLLCEYYGIDLKGKPDDVFFELAYRLAEDNVPYFRERKPRSKEWDTKAQAKLVLDVWNMQEKHKKYKRRFAKASNIDGVCEILRAEGKYKQRGLKQRYMEAVRNLGLADVRRSLSVAEWRGMLAHLAGIDEQGTGN